VNASQHGSNAPLEQAEVPRAAEGRVAHRNGAALPHPALASSELRKGNGDRLGQESSLDNSQAHDNFQVPDNSQAHDNLQDSGDSEAPDNLQDSDNS
jgi:hypothetical protein